MNGLPVKRPPTEKDRQVQREGKPTDPKNGSESIQLEVGGRDVRTYDAATSFPTRGDEVCMDASHFGAKETQKPPKAATSTDV